MPQKSTISDYDCRLKCRTLACLPFFHNRIVGLVNLTFRYTLTVVEFYSITNHTVEFELKSTMKECMESKQEKKKKIRTKKR